MGIEGIITSQTGARQFNAPDFTKYSQFVGGVNATHWALQQYSPQMNGFGRLFMVRPPYAIAKMFGGNNMYSSDSLFMQFKHACEYMCRSVDGFGDTTLESAGTAIQGGFAGRQFKTPTIMKDSTESINIQLYEMTGSLIHTVVTDWMRAIGDPNSGLAHYGGYIGAGMGSDGKEKRMYVATEDNEDDGFAYNESMHTCEFIYILHDRSGAQVERALLLADCYPTNINSSAALNMEPGNHDNIIYTVTFNAVVYQSTIINSIANDLLKQYQVVSNSLNFNPELGDAVYDTNSDTVFARSLGSIPVDSASGTNIGNLPVFTSTNEPVPKHVDLQSMSNAKLAGQDGHKIEENWDGYYNFAGAAPSSAVTNYQ